MDYYICDELYNIIDFESDDINLFYRKLCNINEDIAKTIPNNSSIYQTFKTDMNCIYNQITFGYYENDHIVIKDCIITLREIIVYINL